jgi:hypothetical protein
MRWKPIPNYVGRYLVSDTGDVLSAITGLILSPGLAGNGYLSVSLMNKNGVARTHMLHRLIAEAFIPNPDELPEVNHKDGNKLNNVISNLEWCSYTDNLKHSYVRKLRGRMKSCKLSEEDVAYIRATYVPWSTGETSAKALAKKFGVTKNWITTVASGRKYGNGRKARLKSDNA